MQNDLHSIIHIRYKGDNLLQIMCQQTNISSTEDGAENFSLEQKFAKYKRNLRIYLFLTLSQFNQILYDYKQTKHKNF